MAKYHSIAIPHFGVLKHLVNSTLTKHRKRVFKKFSDAMKEEATKKGLIEGDREFNFYQYRSMHLACKWMSEQNPEFFEYTIKTANN